MKNYIKYAYTLIFGILLSACVDDYEDANPAPLLDAPIGSLTPASSAPTNNSGQIVLEGGEEATVSISIYDAPGRLDSIAYEFTRGGEVTGSTFDNVRGQETGSFDVTFQAPYNLDGVTTMNINVYDSQLDEDGEPAPKSFTFSQAFDVSFAFEAPSLEVDIPADPLFKGMSKDFSVSVVSAPGGGIDTLLASVLTGTLEVNMDDLVALMGQESGNVRMTYTAPEDEVGDFALTLFATDVLQNRSTTVRETFTVEYQNPAPEFSLDFSAADTLQGGVPYAPFEGTISFIVDLGAMPLMGEAGVDTVTAEVGAGSVELGEIITEAGMSTVEGTYTAPDDDEDEGFYTIDVMVTNGEGRSSTESQRIAIYNP